jgi:hypothetical protein
LPVQNISGFSERGLEIMPAKGASQPTYSKCIPQACYSKKCFTVEPAAYNKHRRLKPWHGEGCENHIPIDTSVPAAEDPEVMSSTAQEVSALQWVIQLYNHQ